MFIRLVLALILIPIVELYVLLKVGSLIGPAATIVLIVLTGLAGAYLARTQGFEIVRRLQSEMAAGRLPTGELIDGALVLIGGVLLLTPGFCTDLLGFSFLVPVSRNIIKRYVRLWLQHRIDRGDFHIHRL